MLMMLMMTSNTCQLHCWRYMFSHPRNNSYIKTQRRNSDSIEIAMACAKTQRNKRALVS